MLAWGKKYNTRQLLIFFQTRLNLTINSVPGKKVSQEKIGPLIICTSTHNRRRNMTETFEKQDFKKKKKKVLENYLEKYRYSIISDFSTCMKIGHHVSGAQTFYLQVLNMAKDILINNPRVSKTRHILLSLSVLLSNTQTKRKK